MKLSRGIDRGTLGLACELIASKLALALGVPVPQPAVIRITKGFAESVSDPPARRSLLESIGDNFGTSLLYRGFGVWPVNQSITPSQFAAAADIFAFDALLCNPDRRRVKPNILVRGDDVYAIDHEMAFTFTHAIPQLKDAADYCTFAQLPFLTDHVFYAQLRKKSLFYERLEGAAQAVDDAVLAAIDADIPGAWKIGNFRLILPYVRAVLRRTRSFTYVAQEVLAA